MAQWYMQRRQIMQVTFPTLDKLQKDWSSRCVKLTLQTSEALATIEYESIFG